MIQHTCDRCSDIFFYKEIDEPKRRMSEVQALGRVDILCNQCFREAITEIIEVTRKEYYKTHKTRRYTW